MASLWVAHFGPFEADLRAGQLRKNGLKIKLQDQPFQILVCLLEHAGEVVTREELQQKLWPADTFTDFDHGLNNAINRLREALRDPADRPRYIATLPRRGYRFIAPVDLGAAPVPAHPPAAPVLTPTGRPQATPLHRALLWALAAILALVLVALIVGVLLRAPQPVVRPTRLTVNLPPSDRLAVWNTPVAALSPDGSHIVYVANHGGGSTQLYLRSIDHFETTPIPGTEDAESPFFSPDGESVGFFAEGKLKRVSLSGGAPLIICSAPLYRGGSWGPDGTIIFSPSFSLGLFRVSAAGGTPKPLTVPDRKKGEISHRWPEVLPGNKAVLFTIWTGAGGSFDNARIGVLSLETGEQRVLAEGPTYARYLHSGHLVYAQAGGLVAVPFDLRGLEVTGPPVSILEGISMSPFSGAADFSLSDDGSLAYVPGGASLGERTLLWVNRKGAPQPLPAPPHFYHGPRLSPDGRRLAVSIRSAEPGLWVYDLARGTLTRLTESTIAPYSTWTPDGKHVTFSSSRSGSFNIYRMAVDGSGASERLATSENLLLPDSWSPDGQVLAFTEANPTTGGGYLGAEAQSRPQGATLPSNAGKRSGRDVLA